jgi:hypothetical protein
MRFQRQNGGSKFQRLIISVKSEVFLPPGSYYYTPLLLHKPQSQLLTLLQNKNKNKIQLAEDEGLLGVSIQFATWFPAQPLS